MHLLQKRTINSKSLLFYVKSLSLIFFLSRFLTNKIYSHYFNLYWDIFHPKLCLNISTGQEISFQISESIFKYIELTFLPESYWFHLCVIFKNGAIPRKYLFPLFLFLLLFCSCTPNTTKRNIRFSVITLIFFLLANIYYVLYRWSNFKSWL